MLPQKWAGTFSKRRGQVSLSCPRRWTPLRRWGRMFSPFLEKARQGHKTAQKYYFFCVSRVFWDYLGRLLPHFVHFRMRKALVFFVWCPRCSNFAPSKKKDDSFRLVLLVTAAVLCFDVRGASWSVHLRSLPVGSVCLINFSSTWGFYSFIFLLP